MEQTWTWSVTGNQVTDKTHAEIRDLCNTIGLSGIEGVVPLFDGKNNTELESIGKAYRNAGLSIKTFHLPYSGEDDIASFYEAVRKRAVHKALRWMERAALIGATIGIQHPTTTRYNVDEEGLENYVRQIGKSLETLLPEAQKLGFTIAIENMLPAGGGRFASRPEHFQRLLQDFDHPNLGFCLDTGHALCAGGPDIAPQFQDAMTPKLAAFHLADNAGDRDSHLAPGRGLVNWTYVFRNAAKMQYTGAMCIETPPFAHGPAYSLDAWKNLVSETQALTDRALAD